MKSDLQEFLDVVNKGNQLFHEAAAPLVKQLCDLYDTRRIADLAACEALAKPTLTEIVDNGKQKMMKAVECVIAKHEKELKAIDDKIKLESKSALASIGRYGNCHDSLHSLRMDVIYGFGLGGQCKSQSMGIGGGRWL
jgi:hypothetical protein